MSLTATDENVKSRFIINYDYEENQFRIYVDICIVCVCVIFPIFGTIQFQGLSFAALLCWTAKLGKKFGAKIWFNNQPFNPLTLPSRNLAYHLSTFCSVDWINADFILPGDGLWRFTVIIIQ